MKKTLDRTNPYVLVGGRLPLCYMQGSAGFSRSGEYLGEFTAQGEPVDGVEPEPIASPVSDEAIRAAVARLDPDNPDHFTEQGRPKITAVREILGYPVAVKVVNDALRDDE